MTDIDKKEEKMDELEKTEEDKEFYRLHSDPVQMEIDQRILGRMAPLSFMGPKKEAEEKTKNININSIFEVDGLIFFANDEDIDL